MSSSDIINIFNSCDNEDCKKEKEKLQKENRFLKRKSAIKQLSVLFVYVTAVAILWLPINAGIMRLVLRYFTKQNFIAVKSITHAAISLIFFPAIGCVVANCYGNLKKQNYTQEKIEKAVNKPITHKEYWIKAWWNDFTSNDNLPKNLVYYPTLLIVNGLLCILQYIAYLGIYELFNQVKDNKVEIIVCATAVTVICIAIISTIFSLSLQGLLWRKPETYIVADNAEQASKNIKQAWE